MRAILEEDCDSEDVAVVGCGTFLLGFPARPSFLGDQEARASEIRSGSGTQDCPQEAKANRGPNFISRMAFELPPHASQRPPANSGRPSVEELS